MVSSESRKELSPKAASHSQTSSCYLPSRLCWRSWEFRLKSTTGGGKREAFAPRCASVPPDRCDLLDLRTLKFGCQVSPLSYTCCRVPARPWRRKSCNGCSLSSRTSLCVRIITGAFASFLGGLKRFNKQLGDKCCS